MLKRTKALLSLVLAAVMLSSCGAKGSSSESESSSSAETVTTTKAVVTLPQDSSSGDQSSQDDENKEPSEITPAMWKITADNGNEIYFIGSMHALKDECYPLPDRVMDAYNKSDVVACEMDMYGFTQNLSLQLKVANEYSMYSDKDETIEQHFSAETCENVKGYLDETLGKGTYDIYKHYKPWMVASQCENAVTKACGFDIYLALDLKITEMAFNDGKEIYEVEGESQFDMISSIPDEAYDIKLADYSPENIELIKEQNNALYDIWKTGDIKAFEELFNGVEGDTGKEYTQEQLKILDEYNHMILIDRNVVMADAAEKLLKDHKNTFFMVGLAHFINDDGILALLEKRGYKVETI